MLRRAFVAAVAAAVVVIAVAVAGIVDWLSSDDGGGADTSVTEIRLGEVVRGEIGLNGNRSAYYWFTATTRRAYLDVLPRDGACGRGETIVWTLKRAGGGPLFARAPLYHDERCSDTPPFPLRPGAQYDLTVEGGAGTVSRFEFRLAPSR